MASMGRVRTANTGRALTVGTARVRMAKVRAANTGRALTISIPMTRTAKTYMVRISTTRTVTSMTCP